MSKCIKCGNLFINNPPDDEMCHICKIADLEAKLADTEFRYENLHNLYYKDTEELKQQLTNKEIEIGTWETLYGSVMKSCHNGIEEDKRLREQLADIEKEAQEYLIKYKNYKTKCEKLECELKQLKENK